MPFYNIIYITDTLVKFYFPIEHHFDWWRLIVVYALGNEKYFTLGHWGLLLILFGRKIAVAQ